MGCISSALGLPDIKLDTDAIMERAKTACEDIAKNAPKKKEEFEKEMKKAGEKGYTVSEFKILLIEGKSGDKDVYIAAIKVAAGGEFRSQVKSASWEQVQPALKGQIPDSTPEQLQNKALEMAQKQHDKLIDKAIDQAVAKLTGEDKKEDGKKEDGKKEDKKEKKEKKEDKKEDKKREEGRQERQEG